MGLTCLNPFRARHLDAVSACTASAAIAAQMFAQSAQDLFVELRDLYFATIRTLSGPNLGTSLHRAASHQLASKFAPIHRLDTEFKFPISCGQFRPKRILLTSSRVTTRCRFP